MSHVGDAGKSLSSKPEGGNAFQVVEVSELASSEAFAEEGKIAHLKDRMKEGMEGWREGGRDGWKLVTKGMRGGRKGGREGGREGGRVRTRMPCPSSWICKRRMPPSFTVTTIDLAPASKLFSTSSCETERAEVRRAMKCSLLSLP